MFINNACQTAVHLVHCNVVIQFRRHNHIVLIHLFCCCCSIHSVSKNFCVAKVLLFFYIHKFFFTFVSFLSIFQCSLAFLSSITYIFLPSPLSGTTVSLLFNFLCYPACDVGEFDTSYPTYIHRNATGGGSGVNRLEWVSSECRVILYPKAPQKKR